MKGVAATALWVLMTGETLSDLDLTTLMNMDVKVTSTKQGETATQDIAGGITAISGGALDRRDLHSMEVLSQFVPSLQFVRAGVSDLQPTIRGIQSSGDGTVGLYLDEAVATGANFFDGGGRTPDLGVYDLERVEVLKGPQGTLFGAGSVSGTVRLISNKPDARRFDSRIRVRGNTLEGGDPGFGADAMLNLPLIDDRLAVRGVAWHESRGGYIDVFTGLDAVTRLPRANDTRKAGARIAARYTPGDRLIVDVFGLYQDSVSDGPPGFSQRLDGTLLPVEVIAGPPFVVGLTVPPLAGVFGERIVTSPATSDSNSEVALYGATAEYDAGFGSLLATVSRYENDPYFIGIDTSGIASAFGLIDLDRFFATGELRIPAPFRLHQVQRRKMTAAEMRFSSKFAGPLKFVTGLFYKTDATDTELNVVLADPVTGVPLCTVHARCIADPASAAAQSMLFGSLTTSDIHSSAVFGHAAYSVTDALTIEGGARYYESSERDRNFTLQAFQGSIPFTLPPAFGGPVQTEAIPGVDSEADASKFTWDAGLGYRTTPDRFYYARVATGFRRGGINDTTGAIALGVQIPATFEPDTVLSYEVGTKTTWLERRLTANASVFRMLWDGVQVSGQDATGSVNFVSNAAQAHIDGAELELQARPSSRWLLSLAATWIDARLTADQEEDDPLDLFPAGRRGDAIPKVPEWAFAAGVEHLFRVGGFDAALQLDAAYAQGSRRYFNSTFENDSTVGGYFITHLSCSLLRGPWEIRLFANNLADRAPILDEYGDGADPQYQVSAEPRALGLQLQWHRR